jgi:hypothetical protein
MNDCEQVEVVDMIISRIKYCHMIGIIILNDIYMSDGQIYFSIIIIDFHMIMATESYNMNCLATSLFSTTTIWSKYTMDSIFIRLF